VAVDAGQPPTAGVATRTAGAAGAAVTPGPTGLTSLPRGGRIRATDTGTAEPPGAAVPPDTPGPATAPHRAGLTAIAAGPARPAAVPGSARRARADAAGSDSAERPGATIAARAAVAEQRECSHASTSPSGRPVTASADGRAALPAATAVAEEQPRFTSSATGLPRRT